MAALGLTSCASRNPPAATQPATEQAHVDTAQPSRVVQISVPWPAASATQPTNVSLHVEADRLDALSQQLSDQLSTRVTFAARQPTSQPFKYDADAPYVTAVGGMLAEGGFSPLDSQDVLLSPQPPLQIVQFGDQAALVVSRAHCTSTVVVGDKQPTQYLYQIQMMLLADPALKILNCSYYAVADTLDFDGSAYGTAGSDNWQPSVGMRMSPKTTWPVVMNILSAAPAKLIHRLTFNIHCLQVAQEASLTLTTADLSGAKSVGDDTLRVTPTWEKRPHGNRLNLVLSGRAAEGYLDLHWQNMTWSGAIANASDGNPLPLRPAVLKVNTAGKTITVGITPAHDGAKFSASDLASIRVALPLSLRVLEVPIELHDIPLP